MPRTEPRVPPVVCVGLRTGYGWEDDHKVPLVPGDRCVLVGTLDKRFHGRRKSRLSVGGPPTQGVKKWKSPFALSVLLRDDGGLVGFGVCHCGPGTEAGNGKCYVKFGAVRLGPTAGALFDRLLDACEALAASKGISRLEAGVNKARHGAYRKMLERGFHTEIQGVAMHRPNEPGYNRPEVYLIDDWREPRASKIQ